MNVGQRTRISQRIQISRPSTLFVLVLAFVAVRLLVLFSAPYAIFDDEELYNGTVARELARGTTLSFREYIHFPHEGGALCMTLLTVPFFKVFGTSLVALKLSALSVSALTFLIWIRLAARFVSEKTAWCLALFLILAPPLLLKSDLMTWGHHNNVNLLIAATIYLIVGYLASKTDTGRGAFGIGLVCGFGLFFAYISVSMLLTCVVVLIYDALANRRRPIGWFAAGTLFGFSPWLLIRLVIGFGGPDVFDSSGHGDLLSVGRILREGFWLLLNDLPLSACFRENLVPIPCFFSYLLGVTIAAIVIPVAYANLKDFREHLSSRRETARRPDNRAALVERVALLYCGLFVIVYCVSPFNISLGSSEDVDNFINYRYLMSLWPVLLLLVAIGVGNYRQKDSQDKWMLVAKTSGICMIAGLGVLSVASTVSLADLGSSSHFRGYSYERFGERIGAKYLHDPGQIVSVSRQIDQDCLADYYRGIGWAISNLPWRDPGAMQSAERVIGRLPPEYRHFAYEGLGWSWTVYTEGDMDTVVSAADMVEAEYRGAFYRGVGWAVARRFYEDLARVPHYLDRLPEQYRDDGYDGAGRVVGDYRAVLGVDVVQSLSPGTGEFGDPIRAGAEETTLRYGEGRFMDGPITIAWGPLSFYQFSESRIGRE